MPEKTTSGADTNLPPAEPINRREESRADDATEENAECRAAADGEAPRTKENTGDPHWASLRTEVTRTWGEVWQALDKKAVSEECWKKGLLVEPPGYPQKLSPELENPPSWEPNLGPFLRMQLLSVALCMDHEEAQKTFASGTSWKGHFVGRGGGTYSRLRIGKDWDSRSSWAALSRALRKVGGDNCRSPFDFMYRHFTGPEAPKNFYNWILGGRYDPDHASSEYLGDRFLRVIEHKREFEFIPDTQGRGPLIHAVKSHLEAEDDRPILCVAGNGMPNGLTALALHIWATLRPIDNKRPWCYLPVARGRAGIDDPRFQALVARLFAFYQRRDPSRAQPSRTELETDKQIEFIRNKIATTPAVLILDGYMTASEAMSTRGRVVDFIRDEPVVPLLERLVQPQLGSWEDFHDPTIFGKTRIIVLGNSSLDAEGGSGCLAPYCAAEHKDLRLVPPKGDKSRRRLFDLLGVTGEMRSMAESVMTRHELPVTETNIWLIQALHELGEGPDVPLPGNVDIGDIAALIVKALLKRDSNAWLTLAFATLSDTELRHLTLRRLIARFQQASGGAERIDRDTIALLSRVFGGLVTDGRGESVPGLHERERERAYDTSLWGNISSESDAAEHSSDFALDMPNPDVRDAFRRAFETSAPDICFQIQRILAEMSQQQSSIKARHGKRTEESGLRSQQRLVQALYHGFLSIPRAGDKGSIVPINRSFLPIIPTDPHERLCLLYDEIYLRCLERRPEWAFSRRFGADAVKLDLLDLIDGAIKRHMGPHAGQPLPLQAEPGENEPRPIGDEVVRHATRSALRRLDLERLGRLAFLPPRGRSEFRDAPAPYAKVIADWLMLQNDHPLAEEFCEWTLEKKAALSIKFPEIASLASGPALEQYAVSEAARIAEELRKQWDLSGQSHDVRNLAEVKDLIERLGTAQAQRADEVEGSDEGSGIPHLKTAIYLFRVAQELPRHFVVNRRIISDAWSASAALIFIRSALKLAEKATEAFVGEEDAINEYRDWLFGRACLLKDRLALQVHRFPAEKAHLLIIEAVYQRLRWDDEESLRVSYELLQEADSLIVSDQNQPTSRMAFLLERNKVLRKLGLQAKGDRQRHLFFAVSRDLERLLRLAREHKMPLMESVALHQIRKLRSVVSGAIAENNEAGG